MKRNHFKYAFLLLILFVIGCGEPADISQKREELNNTWQQIYSEAHQIDKDNKTAITNCLDQLNSLKISIVDYTENANKRGYQKDNTELISDIDNCINKLQGYKDEITHKEEEDRVAKEAEKQREILNANNSSNTESTYSSETKTCNWCGKSFSGNSWTVSLGEPVQWKYSGCCSSKCAMESYKSQR